MADNSDSDQPTKSNLDDSVTVFASEIDDDWGEAFEADDFMLDPDEDTSNDFFLEDDDLDSETPVSSEPEQPGQTSPDRPSPPSDDTSSPNFVAGLLLSCQNFVKTCKAKFFALPVIYRVSLLAVSLLFLVVSSYLLTSSTDAPLPETATIDDKGLSPSVAGEPEGSLEDKTAVSPEKPAEKIRKKWPLPPFLISTSDNMKGDDIFFVEVDITLILLRETEEDVSSGMTVRVRDMIYQFFNNRPLYELRRYSLARGEMNRKLFSWLEKQWPEGQIGSIVFNRYRVL
jgi:hypothetical protein